MAKIMHERYPWFRNSHAYGEPGGVLGLIGLSQVQPAYFAETLSRYQWWFALAWQPGNGLHFTIPHMGAPYMEGPILINNGYAIVTNAHKQTLQITGSSKRNWLDVSKAGFPISDVMILQGTDGNVTLRCKIPGPEIFYTTDGSAPNAQSRKYRKPFLVKTGTVVKAIATADGNVSKTAERGFGLDKSEWSIVNATGVNDAKKAIHQAQFAIDGDNRIGWVPDNGEGAKGYPHQLVIDLGSKQNVELAAIRFIIKDGSASRVAIEAAPSRNAQFQEIGSTSNTEFVADTRIALSSKSKVRFLKFTFDSPLKENSKLLMVGEIDVR